MYKTHSISAEGIKKILVRTGAGAGCSSMANFCCSIEMEPKTLNQGLLNHAREVAVDIVVNKEANEASNIFVEGLKPVVADEKENPLVYNYQLLDETKNETGCQCSFSSAIIDSPADQSKLKEPLSAPF